MPIFVIISSPSWFVAVLRWPLGSQHSHISTTIFQVWLFLYPYSRLWSTYIRDFLTRSGETRSLSFRPTAIFPWQSVIVFNFLTRLYWLWYHRILALDRLVPHIVLDRLSIYFHFILFKQLIPYKLPVCNYEPETVYGPSHTHHK